MLCFSGMCSHPNISNGGCNGAMASFQRVKYAANLAFKWLLGNGVRAGEVLNAAAAAAAAVCRTQCFRLQVDRQIS